ncbi:MAG: VapC toxin family PIN domain ribonuclease [Armatimonadetes bacterium CG_4_10_14_3_um_filter_66_18]|nr:type II toxin-antitoxin system VapC family toxin [Armatimonadota bacterium]OIP05391.1 MAG: VapC toxin family PIN domain ribonuclease [Armatimonadetes bacterium CG2_30_66_41]PIU95065.1 MAG: VapC toxin family PIN domain ribonuclease [Armatimonadetes bacterium CG06_land_8_20_14_3_00_66_21]PIX37431.1 MAG: VapC toxin family PIN domain ribonuclease [Armatimonadetes bacterium CG_4_8_14_3_um_filter_66_20]PIY43085.1 MAG: VapC toxin family PIN domain ribonuclease [Armatimonadetes bacterium CG_4_10_14_
MKAVDTNVLVRFLVNDDPRQAGRVRNRLKQAEAEGEVLFVPLLVLLETLWVLESAYDVGRTEILDSLDDLLLLPVLRIEEAAMVRRLTSVARQTSTGLADLLIGLAAQRAGCDGVLTFDKQASKSELFELLG